MRLRAATTISYISLLQGPLNSSTDQSFHDAGVILGLAPLLKYAFDGADLAPLANQLIENARRRSNANTLLDLSITLELLKKREPAMAIQANALKVAQRFQISSAPVETTLRLLVIKAPGDLSANTPIECLLEGSNISVELLYTSPDLPLPELVPEHDLLFVAVAESNENKPILEYLDQRLASWPQPYLNRPSEILKLERSRAYGLLSSISGVVIPQTLHMERRTLQQIADGQLSLDAAADIRQFAVIVRPVDSHAGRGLIKAESLVDLGSYLNDRSDSNFFLSPFVDYRSKDGLFRKYRVVMMLGHPYLCHMGISSHWMVHYPYPEMMESVTRRTEEASAMATFSEGFAKRHEIALAAIHREIQLDYFGMDCAEDINGNLVIFEVASAMLVHAMDNPDIFPYKAAQMQKVFGAFRDTLANYDPKNRTLSEDSAGRS
jgi:hypothetical protein